ncbi:hypothetical protein GCM10020219_026910 [Nonomuraea dietziae]
MLGAESPSRWAATSCGAPLADHWEGGSVVYVRLARPPEFVPASNVGGQVRVDWVLRGPRRSSRATRLSVQGFSQTPDLWSYAVERGLRGGRYRPSGSSILDRRGR